MDKFGARFGEEMGILVATAQEKSFFSGQACRLPRIVVVPCCL